MWVRPGEQISLTILCITVCHHLVYNLMWLRKKVTTRKNKNLYCVSFLCHLPCVHNYNGLCISQLVCTSTSIYSDGVMIHCLTVSLFHDALPCELPSPSPATPLASGPSHFLVLHLTLLTCTFPWAPSTYTPPHSFCFSTGFPQHFWYIIIPPCCLSRLQVQYIIMCSGSQVKLHSVCVVPVICILVKIKVYFGGVGSGPVASRHFVFWCCLFP